IGPLPATADTVGGESVPRRARCQLLPVLGRDGPHSFVTATSYAWTVRLVFAPSIAACAAAPACTSLTAASHPTIRVVTASPLVVAGTGFAAGERVTVTALTTVRRTRAVVH